jgi:hypothetical protein
VPGYMTMVFLKYVVMTVSLVLPGTSIWQPG